MEKFKKRNHRYQLSLQALPLAGNDKKQIEFEFENHNDLFKVIESAKQKNVFANENEAAEFAIGLKLFTEVMLRNRSLPLFEELSPAIGAFMKKLKSI